MATKKDPKGDSDTRGGFAIGDMVVVVAKKSSYHGDRGKVSKFCKNGSHKQIYVHFEEAGENRVFVSSLAKVVKKSTSSTEEAGVPVKHVTLKEKSTDSTCHDSEGSNEHSRTTSSSYGKRVLFLFEYVQNIQEQYKHDRELSFKLKEVEKLILGLNLNS